MLSFSLNDFFILEEIFDIRELLIEVVKSVFVTHFELAHTFLDLLVILFREGQTLKIFLLVPLSRDVLLIQEFLIYLVLAVLYSIFSFEASRKLVFQFSSKEEFASQLNLLIFSLFPLSILQGCVQLWRLVYFLLLFCHISFSHIFIAFFRWIVLKFSQSGLECKFIAFMYSLLLGYFPRFKLFFLLFFIIIYNFIPFSRALYAATLLLIILFWNFICS